MMTSPDVEELVKSWNRSLRSTGKSPETIRAYNYAVAKLTDWAISHDRPTDPAEQTRDDLQDFMGHLLATKANATAGTAFRNLRQWFKWLQTEPQIIDTNPMDGMKHPSVEEKVPDVIPDADLRALLDVTAGRDFLDRRDRALVRVLLDTGMRVGELVSMTVPDVNLDAQVLLVSRSKTKRGRLVPIGTKATAELDRYLLQRRKHKAAASPAVWLGQSGPISDSLVRKILEKRCKQAGIARIHPHQFRHTAAHKFLLAGGQEQDLGRIAGWTPGSVMLARYGASAASERAQAAHRQFGAGDSL